MGITVEFYDDGCALLTMRNGQNRLNLTTLNQFNDALDEVERNEDTRILVTTGEGRFYSNGIDLEWMMSENNDVKKKFFLTLYDTLWRVMHFPMPTVAAINGHSFAGGAFLALCHDYRVMRSDRGWITWNEVLLGSRFPAPLHDFLHLKLSPEALRESVIFAKRITGPEAVNLKIVDGVASESSLISESKKLGFQALGKNVINRADLHIMKKDLMPRIPRKSLL